MSPPPSTTTTMIATGVDREQARLISALTTTTTPAEIRDDDEGQPSDEQQQQHTEEEEEEVGVSASAATATVYGTSFAGNTLSESSDDDYCEPESDDEWEEHHFHRKRHQAPTHQANDSLCYSTDNDFDVHTIGSASTISYLGSVFSRSVDVQQAFPSSMFPGQKLISPSTDRKRIDDERPPRSRGGGAIDTGGSPGVYPSYYYYSTTSFYKDSYQNSDGGGNVYQKRHGGQLWKDVPDGDDDEGREPSWKRCWRCFFSPRVVVTLAVCGIIVLNLTRLGEHHHHHKNSFDRHNHWSSVNAGGINNGYFDSTVVTMTEGNLDGSFDDADLGNRSGDPSSEDGAIDAVREDSAGNHLRGLR